MADGDVDTKSKVEVEEKVIQGERSRFGKEETPIELAMRIVSPGLPSLSEEMKSTMKMSQRISQQQRTLIATINPDSSGGSGSSGGGGALLMRNSGGLSGSETSDSCTSAGGERQSVEPIVINTQRNALYDELDKIKSPQEIKRLKRNNKPAPLSMSDQRHNPAIRSAPGWYQGPPRTARPVRKRAYPYPMYPQRERLPPQYYVVREPYFMPQAVAHTPFPHPMAHRRFRFATSPIVHRSTPNVSRKYQTQDSTPSIAKAETMPRIVTDVYAGDYTRVAPLSSQPLYSQKETLCSATKLNAEGYRDAASDSDIQDMEESYVSDVESNALNDEEKDAPTREESYMALSTL